MTPREVWTTGAHLHWLDAEGRPLGEVASPAYPPDTREARCPYSGARLGKPMNLAALGQWGAWKDRCWATWAAVRGATALDAWRGLSGCVSAPLTSDRPVPVPLSILYKTSVGLHQALTMLILDDPARADQPLAALGDGGAFLEALDRGGWLVGSRQACAGPPGDIAHAWSVLAGAPAEGEPLPVRPADGEDIVLVVALTLETGRRLAAGDRAGIDGYRGGLDPAWPLGVRLWHRPPVPWLTPATRRAEPDPAAALALCGSSRVRRFLEGCAGRDHRGLEAWFWEV